MTKKNKNRINVVYSTNPDFHYEEETQEEDTLAPEQQLLYVSLDRKNRGGKEVTLVEGFKGSKDDLKALANILKSKCGVGGSAKNGEIVIQGNFVQKTIHLLSEMRYVVKRKGG